MADIIIFPKSYNFKDEIKILRAKLQDLINERDELVYIECENIRAAYILEFGGKEYRILKLSAEYQKLRRKIDLLQAKINRQEEITVEFLKQIDAVLDKEFEAYFKNLRQKFEEISWATDLITSPKISGDDLINFKKMYKEIVKKLHPDLNPNLTDEELEIFYKVVEAYQNGWFEILELYYHMIVDKDEFAITDDMDLKKEVDRLKEMIRKLEENIKEIKSSYPYDRKDLLDNPAKISAYHIELDGAILDYEVTIDDLKDRLEEMVKDVRD